MAASKSGLGKGLDALLPEAMAGVDSSLGPTELPIDQLHRGAHQPRTRFRPESIDELAQSIRAQGVIEPIIVRPRQAGGFEIVAGERRWRAAQRAGLERLPVVVRDVDDRQAVALALVENIQREDLNPIEEAQALKHLLGEQGLTHEELAETVGKSRTAVTNALRLLNLARPVRELLEEGALEMGHGRALLPLPQEDQESAARRVVAGQLSVRRTEALVKQLLAGPTPPAEPDGDVRRLERTLSERLGAPASIRAGRGGSGRIVIRYGSLDELDGLLGRLGMRNT